MSQHIAVFGEWYLNTSTLEELKNRELISGIRSIINCGFNCEKCGFSITNVMTKNSITCNYVSVYKIVQAKRGTLITNHTYPEMFRA